MKKVVLVDDEQHFREEFGEIMSSLLEVNEIKNYSNGVSALNDLLQDDPDLLITDVLMPGMSGLELIRKIRKIKPDLPIILMSEQSIYALNAYDLGIQGFIVKPLVKNRVLEALNRVQW